jgi:predicted TIM-barrel fold metal-dependent hydrolase
MQRHGFAGSLLSHALFVSLAGIAFVIGAGVWSLSPWRYGLLATCIAAIFLTLATLGVYRFQQSYPRAELFSTARLRDGWAILLGNDIALSKYQPRSTLIVDRKPVTRAAFPAIDVHFHLESLSPSVTPERLVEAMDAAGIAKLVNLGGAPGMFERFATTFKAKYPDRFILFVKPDPSALQREGGVEQQVEWIKKAVHMGARGIKESKSFGLGQIDASGALVAVDDARLDPLWNLAGQLGMPVLIHTGEPAAFYTPIDQHNERLEELIEHTQFSLYGPGHPTHEELMKQREHLIARHPGTNFIAAHMGMNPEDLKYVAYMLDKYPNYYVDMSSVVQELGRQPYTARRFFIQYQDRILFGTDGGYGLTPEKGWTPERMYRSYIEFLETANEYIEYPEADLTKQGRWQVYGLELPKDVLEKIYVLNAQRLIPTDAAIEARLADVDREASGGPQLQ